MLNLANLFIKLQKTKNFKITVINQVNWVKPRPNILSVTDARPHTGLPTVRARLNPAGESPEGIRNRFTFSVRFQSLSIIYHVVCVLLALYTDVTSWQMLVCPCGTHLNLLLLRREQWRRCSGGFTAKIMRKNQKEISENKTLLPETYCVLFI